MGLEIVRFGAVGVANTAFGFAVFAVLQSALGTWLHYQVIVVISNVVSIVEAYILQRWLVFRFTGGWWAGLARFSTVYLVALGVSLLLMPVLVELLSVDPIPAYGVVLVVQALGTYLAHKLFTFRHRTG